MQKSSICLIVFTCLGIGVWATDGVKGGQRPRYPTNGGQHLNSSQTGLCYKTVPYSHVLALNSSGSPYNTIPQPHGGSPPRNDDWITILDCCDGYERNVTTGRCEPHCDRGCFGGRCTGPNICSCQPGWSSDDGGVCMPVCTYGCKENAYCYTPEVCVCKLGYDEVNDVCKPICPDGCVSGECVAPRVCGCQRGYVLNERNECVPTCEGGCTHGRCTAPGVCTCHDGYVNPPGDYESCVPHCPADCNSGECVSPGVCRCRPGYVRDRSGRCFPAMPGSSQCGHGYTVDPVTGRCAPAPTNSSQPLPVPTDCRYGCGPNGICIGHNRCACQLGFVPDLDTGRCVHATPTNATSQCRYGCGPRGQCVGPNTCACEPGFHNDADTGRCVRHDGAGTTCQYPCLNGQCTGPNECTCNQGYTHDLRDSTRSRCVPVCAGGCHNGVCTMPNYCICNPGYRKEPGVKGRQRCVPQE